MKTSFSTRLYWTLIVLVTMLLAGSAWAQFFPGQQGGGGNRSRGNSSTRTYAGKGDVGDAVISMDPETRSLIVIADEKTRQYISQVVSNLDRPKPQVLIKVVFVELTHTDSLDLGIESYSYNTGLGMATNFAVVAGQNSGLSTIVPQSITSKLSSTGNTASGLYQIMGNDYQVTLRAIATAGKAKLLSKPSIIARNNQPATITVGQSVPLITDVRFDNFGNAINSVRYTDVGIILRVTPFITSEGMVEMIVSPETSDLVNDRSQWVPISTGPNGTVSAPLINSRSADTVVVTPDGQTVIIGGLMQDAKAEAESKVPILGDIPWIGSLFRHKMKNGNKTELLIFLTPHIIQAPAEMAALATKEQNKSELDQRLTEEEMNRFLDKLPVKEPAPAPQPQKGKQKNH
jgi:general secretion pathway protein D